MRKVVLYIASSLDNFIARPDGDISWLQTPDLTIEGEDFGYMDFYESIDTTLMGNKTYQQVLGFDMPFPYDEKENFVFSKSNTGKDKYVTFISENLVEFVTNLKKLPKKDIWLIGGGEINSILLENKLIDKIILTIVPVSLGEGILIFNQKPEEQGFILEKSTSYKNGMVQLVLNAK